MAEVEILTDIFPQAYRWDYEAHAYTLHWIPSYFNAESLPQPGDDLGCACCGAPIELGTCYASFEIHDVTGRGFMVCEHCHAAELKRKLSDKGVS